MLGDRSAFRRPSPVEVFLRHAVILTAVRTARPISRDRSGDCKSSRSNEPIRNPSEVPIRRADGFAPAPPHCHAEFGGLRAPTPPPLRVSGVGELDPGGKWMGRGGQGVDEEVVEMSRGEKWIGRDGVLDWLARVRIGGLEAMSHGVGITERRIRFHAERLEHERLLIRTRVDGAGPLMVITPRGLRRAGYAVNSRNPTRSITGLLHGCGVSWVAAHCERRERSWVGPGELRSQGWRLRLRDSGAEGPVTHMPDLGFLLDGRERWAVEFERVPKSETRLRGILQRLPDRRAGRRARVGALRVRGRVDRAAGAVRRRRGKARSGRANAGLGDLGDARRPRAGGVRLGRIAEAFVVSAR